MVEQIQVLVSSSLRTSTAEHGAALENTAIRTTLSLSSIVLRDVEEHVDEGQGVFRVIKYVPRSAVHAAFEQRRRQIVDHLTAAEAEGHGTGPVDVQRMLSNYYMAWLIVGLYPDTLSYPFEFGGAGGVVTGIPLAMQRVCDRLAFAPSRKIDDDYTTWKYAVTWSGRPVSSLRYTFHDGLGESEEEVVNGFSQATFLFTDKRERLIPASIEYHETDAQDALLAAADSMRAAFAPKLTVNFIVPHAADTTGITAPPPMLPHLLAPFLDGRCDIASFKSEITRLSKRGEIIAGKKSDFESLDGLYLFVLTGDGVQTILQYHSGTYINMRTGDAITLPEYAGKRTLWVKVL
jgi:hypothetical protein